MEADRSARFSLDTFTTKAIEVLVLSRHMQKTPWLTLHWDGETLGPWLADLDDSDVWINLAGRSVNCRYNKRNRSDILNSRVLSTSVLHKAITWLERPPEVWLNASTATIYRHALDRSMDEATGELGGNEPGAPDTWNFSIEVAKAWEEEFFSINTPGTRQVALRSAMTFSPDRGGVFDVFSKLVRHGLGGTNLPGTQFVSWIHEVDFIRTDRILDRQSGHFRTYKRCVSSSTSKLAVSSRILRKAWGATLWSADTAPWMLEIGTFLLRTESELVLKSRRVVPGRLLDAGFTFRYPTWHQAAPDLVARSRRYAL